MKKQTIDINTALFETLKNDYNHHKQNNAYQSQLQSGFDYLEALIKIFASINISVVKDMNEEVYKDIFTKNFKLAPSLGDFKSLASVVFSKSNHKKLINNNELYDLLYTIFNTKISLELVDSTSILDDNKKVKNFNSTIKLLNEYAVSFRNKIKGHGASFKDNDSSLRDTILENLDKVLIQLNTIYDEIISNLTFESIDSNITIKYKDISCELLPIVSYIECDKYSCNKNHKSKLFFYNDGKESKSHYIDYSFNHYFQITQQNIIHQNLKELQEEVLHSTSDTFRQSLLLSNFVGREQELNNTKKHILNSIKNNQSSFVSIVGKPGIGKSAFLTQLQNNIKEDKTITDNINTYTFYAYKNHMGVEEDNYLYKKITSYFDTLGITAKQDEQFDMTTYLEKLFNIYEEDKNTKPLLLIIDGLDEFANPADIIKKFPLNFSSKIHIIFSSRAYVNILSTISAKLANKTEQQYILNEQILIKNGYSLELGKLALNEVEELLSSVITKEINRDTKEYHNIVDTIATQSEGLPLYIYYITQDLKERNIKDDEDITHSIISWAKKLPPKLENFYQDIFKSISPLARKILLILYFSKTGINKRELYQILKNISSNDFITLDKTAFEVEVFNNIEVFLKLNSDDTYSFYHLSVKEAVQEYLKEQDELATLDIDKLKEDNILFEEMIKQNQEYIQDMVYLDKKSDSYEFLQKLIEYLKENNSSKYYKDNFFHLYNSLVWFDIFHHQISFEDIQDKNYKSISTTTKISQQNSEAIDELFKLFDTKENKHLFEIRYAYELAFIKEDYTKVLQYKDMYENYIHELFLDICLNIDKDEYIQKFIEYKDEWENGLNDLSKDFFIEIIKKQDTLIDSFYNIYKIINIKYKKELYHKFTSNIKLIIFNNTKDKHFQLNILDSLIVYNPLKVLELLNELKYIKLPLYKIKSDKILKNISINLIQIDINKSFEIINMYSDIKNNDNTILKNLYMENYYKELLNNIISKYGIKSIDIVKTINDKFHKFNFYEYLLVKLYMHNKKKIINLIKEYNNKDNIILGLCSELSKDKPKEAITFAKQLDQKLYNMNIYSLLLLNISYSDINLTIRNISNFEEPNQKINILLFLIKHNYNDLFLEEILLILDNDKYLNLVEIIKKHNIEKAIQLLYQYNNKDTLYIKTWNNLLEYISYTNFNYAKKLAFDFDKDSNNKYNLLSTLLIKNSNYNISEVLDTVLEYQKEGLLKYNILDEISYILQTQNIDILLLLDKLNKIKFFNKDKLFLKLLAVEQSNATLQKLNVYNHIDKKNKILSNIVNIIIQNDIKLAINIIDSSNISPNVLLSNIKRIIHFSKDKANEYAMNSNDMFKYAILINIAKETKDIDNLNNIIHKVNELTDKELKIQIISYIITLISINFHDLALKLYNNMEDDLLGTYKRKSKEAIDNPKEQVSKNIIYKEHQLLNNNYFLNKINIHNYSTIDSIDIIFKYSIPSILQYYNINIENKEQSKITELLNNLSSKLKKIDDKKEKRKYFNKIKEQVLDDEKLLNEFIEVYGEKFDIEDEDSFDDEFSLKSFEEIKI